MPGRTLQALKGDFQHQSLIGLMQDMAHRAEDVMKKLYSVTPWDPKTQRTATRIWTKVVTGQ